MQKKNNCCYISVSLNSNFHCAECIFGVSHSTRDIITNCPHHVLTGFREDLQRRLQRRSYSVARCATSGTKLQKRNHPRTRPLDLQGDNDKSNSLWEINEGESWERKAASGRIKLWIWYQFPAGVLHVTSRRFSTHSQWAPSGFFYQSEAKYSLLPRVDAHF